MVVWQALGVATAIGIVALGEWLVECRRRKLQDKADNDSFKQITNYTC